VTGSGEKLGFTGLGKSIWILGDLVKYSGYADRDKNQGNDVTAFLALALRKFSV
jgi:hypothetical protein